MEKEIWKDIKGYEGLYQVSNLGRIKSLNYRHTGKEKILIVSNHNSGYKQLQLNKYGKGKMYRVHRLVAEAFIPNPLNLPQVNHKNEMKDDNRVENLEWCNSTYNINYGTRNQQVSDALKGRKMSADAVENMAKTKRGIYNTKNSKPVVQMDKTNKIIAEFPSMCQVQRELGLSIGHIYECCRGKRNTCGGYKWKYKEAS